MTSNLSIFDANVRKLQIYKINDLPTCNYIAPCPLTSSKRIESPLITFTITIAVTVTVTITTNTTTIAVVQR
jgi:hypothetical protein